MSAVGHFVSFILSICQQLLLIPAFYFFSESPEATIMVVRNLGMFLIPSIHFLVYPLVETAFSENLRESLTFVPRMP